MQHTAAGSLVRLGRGQRAALLLIQQGDHPLGQMVSLGDVAGRQAGVLTGDQQADVLPLQHLQTAGGVAAAHIVEHEHGVQAAGNSQIQDLQRAVLGVLILILLLGQGHPLPLHVQPVADEHPVVIAPGGKAKAVVDLQVLHRVQDLGAVLDDLAEQAPQGLAAVVEDTSRIEDGTVDAAALEDADVLQIHAVGGKELVGIHLHGVHTAQLLNGSPAGHHGTGGGCGLLQAQRSDARNQGGGQRCTHAEHGGQGCGHAVGPAAKQQEHQPAEHGGTQQDQGCLAGAALTGALPEALLHQRLVPLDRAAEQHPGVFLIQAPGQHPDQVLIPDTERALQPLGGSGGEVVAVSDGSQQDTAAQQGQEQAQCGHAGKQRPAGVLIALGVEQGDRGLHQRTAGGQRRHGVCTGAALEALQAIPQDRPAHSQRTGQKEQVGGIERRRGDHGVKGGHRGQQPLGNKAKVEQHHGKDALQHTPQRQLRAHPAELLPHLLGRFRLGFLFRLLLSLRRGRGRFLSRLGRGLLCQGGRPGGCFVLFQPHQRQAHAVVLAGGLGAGRGLRLVLVRALAKELERLFRFRLNLWRGFRGRPCLLYRLILGKHHGDGRALRRCGSFRLHGQHLFGGILHLLHRGRLGGAIEHGLEFGHLCILLLLLRGQGFLAAGRLRLFLGLGCGPGFRLRRCGGFRRGGQSHRLCFLQLSGLQCQLQAGLGFFLMAQHDLTRGRQLILHDRDGRLLFVLFAVKELAQQAAGILLFLIAALHLFGHLCHAGAEKRAELLVLRIDLFLCQLFALIILWHPSPSLFWSRRSGRRFLLCGALALDLVQDDASCHRDIEAVHTGALSGHIQPHHTIAELFHQLGYTAALAAQHQCDGAGQVVLAQGHAVHIGTVDEHPLILQAADGLADVGHAGHRQALGRTGAGLDNGGGHGRAAPLGDDDAVGSAQQSRAHHRAQIMGVLDAVTQHQERGLPLLSGNVQQVLHGHIFDLAGKGSHALVALGAGHQAQLVGVHPLDRGPGLLGHGGIVSCHGGGHALRDQHGIHAGTALEQLGHGVFAVDQALILGLLLRAAAAGAARHFLFVH